MKPNKIKGSIIYKLILYLLIGITALSTCITGGLLCQMYSYGIMDLNKEDTISYMKERIDNDIMYEKIDNVYDVVHDFLYEKYYDMRDGIQNGNWRIYDFNNDNVIDREDFELLLKKSDLNKYISDSKHYSEDDNFGIMYEIVISRYTDDEEITKDKLNSSVLYSNKQIKHVNSMVYEWMETEICVKPIHYTDEEGRTTENGYGDDAEYGYEDATEVETTEYEYGDVNIVDRIENGNNDIYMAMVDGEGLDYLVSIKFSTTEELYAAEETGIKMQENAKLWADNRELIVVLFIVSVLLCIILSIVSMAHAGLKKGKQEITLNMLERMPVEIVLCGMGICVALLYLAFDVLSYETPGSDMRFRFEMVINYMCFWIISVGISSAYILLLLMFNNIVAKVKAHVLVKESLICRFFRYLLGREGKVTCFFRYIKSRIPLVAKAVIAYVIFVVCCIILFAIVINYIYYNAGAVFGLLLIIGVAVTFAYVIFVIMINEIHKGGKELANGNLNHKIDTRYMFGPFKEHGENLNNINDSIQLAVEERMKSEHMKTELITNVSHDIKTPLTSIINYVDLLQKEGIDKEPEKSYIDVLERQSARLKKLITDLVDASKASTGNIEMNMECMDVNMVMTQAFAEYEEKLKAVQMTLVMNTTPEPAKVMADGRYLWRVFDNLLSNIYKYSMPGTRVYMQIEDDGANVVVSFKNISRDPLNISSDELMERFVRGDSSRNTEGSGLGLSIAKSLCNLMHAEFDVAIDGDLFKAWIKFKKVIDT